jgi:hypothetical protein
MRGRTLPLSIPRRIISDLMHFASAVPVVAVERRMNIRALVAARGHGDDRLAWSAIFAKAWAAVAQEMPELRRTYLSVPWPHLYEYPASVAIIAIEREVAGEPAVLGCVIKDPGSLPVGEINQRIRTAAHAPIEASADFRRVVRLAALPLLVRRAVMWIGLSLARPRANYFGTFAISAVAAFGADLITPRSVWTTLLSYGVLDADGCLDVRITFDHRAVDGATIARALARLEEMLNGPVLSEVRGGDRDAS